MSALAHLRAIGCDATALDLARALSMPIELVYVELVAAESRGLVRVCSHYPESNGPRVMLWGAI